MGLYFPKKNREDIGKTWWEPYAGLLVDVSGWLVVPVVLGILGGKWLDAKFHTKPYLMLLSLGIAFLITNIGILKKGIAMMREAEKKSQSLHKDKPKEQSHESETRTSGR